MSKFVINDMEKFIDHRGIFHEIPNITGEEIAQYSVSVSKKNVLRGLHYQYMPPMGKQITILKGGILDVAVDLRINSPLYGTHETIRCTPDINGSIYIKPGFAHGFLSLEDDTTILYFQTGLYNPKCEGSINPFDEKLNIDWGISKEECILSDKDRDAEDFLSFSAKNLNWRIIL